jgi:UDP-N-acetylglucosamine acyltransferase
VVIANSVNMAGHIIIDDFVGIGGLTPIHQFVRIGAHTFIGGGLRVSKDVPPFILAMGEPLRFGGLNLVGLKRRGFSEERLNLLKQAFKILYRSKLTLEQAVKEIESGLEKNQDIQYLLKFLEASERGIIR